MEIERKFLIKELPKLATYESAKISQGYISVDPVIRIRAVENDYFLTVKSKGAMIREEFELQITLDQYNTLYPKIEGKIIEKMRYFIPLSKDLTAELDIYEKTLEGLLTVEVEFSSTQEASSFHIPEWFGKDITFDNRYKNNALALYGIPK